MTPVVRKLLIAIVAVFFMQQCASRFMGLRLEDSLGFRVRDFWRGYFWQFFTYPFLHQTLTHLLVNGFALYMFGTELEARWGSKKFFKYYALCATGGALFQTIVWAASLLVAPSWSDFLGNTPIIGASGALYGLLVAFGVLYGDSIMLFMFVVPMKIRQAVILFCCLEIFSFVFYSDTQSGGGPAHLVHLGGLIAGFLYLKYAGNDLNGRGGMFRRRGLDKDEVRRRLSLVVNNDPNKKEGKYPITWN